MAQKSQKALKRCETGTSFGKSKILGTCHLLGTKYFNPCFGPMALFAPLFQTKAVSEMTVYQILLIPTSISFHVSLDTADIHEHLISRHIRYFEYLAVSNMTYYQILREGVKEPRPQILVKIALSAIDHGSFDSQQPLIVNSIIDQNSQVSITIRYLLYI